MILILAGALRGQLIRVILAYSGRSWDEHDSDAIVAMMGAHTDDQSTLFMCPPVLIENKSDFALSEMLKQTKE
ncbi:hypothetical protein BH09PSE3_BH09PSE3_25860 [soil metagenome]